MNGELSALEIAIGFALLIPATIIIPSILLYTTREVNSLGKAGYDVLAGKSGLKFCELCKMHRREYFEHNLVE